jgi:hypothetical protein
MHSAALALSQYCSRRLSFYESGRIKKAATMRISLNKQLSMLVVAIGFAALEASLATSSIAKQSHVRHQSASAERIADKGSRGTWNGPNSAYASAPFRGLRHDYPDPFRGDCTLDDGPFPCGDDP